MNIGSLTGEINLIDTMTAVLVKLDTVLQVTDTSARHTSQGISQLERSMVGATTKGVLFGNIITKVASTISSLPQMTYRAGQEVAGAMATIARTTGQTGDQLKDLQGSFKNVFVQVPDSAQVVAKAIGDVNVRLGFQGKELEKITKQLLDYANANQVEVGPATRSVTTLMKALELDVKDVGLVMDKLTYASQQSGINVNTLAQGVISGGIAFKEMGFGLDESIALFAQFEKVGANVTDVTSSLHRTLGRLAKEGVTDVAGAFKSLLKQIAEAPTFMDGARLSIEAFGAKAGPKLVEEIRGGTYDLTAFVDKLQQVEGATDRTANATETFDEKMSKLHNRVTLALSPLGSRLLDALNALTPALEGLIVNVTGATDGAVLYDKYQQLPQPIRKTAEAVTAVSLAVWGLNTAINALMGTGLAKWVVGAGASTIRFFTLLASQIEIFGIATGASTTIVYTLETTLAGFTSTVSFFVIAAASMGTQIYVLVKAFDSMWESILTGKPIWDTFVNKLSSGFLGDIAKWVTGAEELEKAMNRAAGSRTTDVELFPDIGFVGPMRIEDKGEYVYDPKKLEAEKEAREDAERALKAYNKSVIELGQTWTTGEKSLRAAHEAFGNLTSSQLENFDVQQRVVPEILKMAAAGDTLNESQFKVLAAYQTNLAAMQEGQAQELVAQGITLQTIEYNKTLGISIEQMAAMWGVLPGSLEAYTTALQKTLSAEQGLASFHEALREQERASRERERQQANAVSDAITEISNAAEKERTNQYKTETQMRIEAINKEYDAKLTLLQLGKTPEQAEALKTASDAAKGAATGRIIEADELDQFKLFDELTKQAAKNMEALNIATRTTALDGLATFFTSLGQISGGLGDFMASMGSVVVGLKAANDVTNQIGGKSGKRLGGDFGVMSVAFDKNASSAQRAAAGFQAVTSVASGAIDVWNATASHATRAGNALGGMMAGAKAGAAFGPWGIAIGAAAGMVVGIIRGKPAWAKAADEVARDFGVKISDELGKTIAERAKTMFKGDRLSATIFSLKDIMAEAGGITDKNVEMFTGKLRDVFSMIETGKFDLAQAVQVLNDSFGEILTANTDAMGYWSKAVKEIIALDTKFGTNAKAINDAMAQQAMNLITSFNAIVAGTKEAMSGYAGLKKAVDDATEAVEKARTAGNPAAEAAAQAELTLALEAQGAAAEAAGRSLKDLGVIAVGAFGAAMATGATFYQALQAAGPGLKDLRQSFIDLGMDVEDPFLKLLMVQSAVMERAPHVLASFDALSSTLVSMSNLGILNEETLGSVGRTAAEAYSRVQSEVAAAGGTTRDALLPMQGYLHAAEQAAKDLGVPLDANTAMLIEQSKELNLWKDLAKTPAQLQMEATEKLTDAIERMINAMMGIPESLPNPFKDWTVPDGGIIDPNDPRHRGPTQSTPSVPSNASNYGARGGSQNVTLVADGREIARLVSNKMPSDLALRGAR